MGRRSRTIRERRKLRELEALRGLRLVATAPERGCLFCREGDGPWISVEHVFAESLGNKQLIVPRGIVCDPCNNNRLSVLDQALVDFMSIALRRTFLGIPNKEGRLRILNLMAETIEHQPSVDGGNPILIVKSKNKGKRAIKEIARFPNGRVQVQMTGSGGRRMTPRYAFELSRSLLKSALECAWIDHKEKVFESQFDHIREQVLGKPWDGYLMAGTKSHDPNSRNVMLLYNLLQDEEGIRMPVVASIYGVILVTDSRLVNPVMEVSEKLAQVFNFKEADLRGMKLLNDR